MKHLILIITLLIISCNSQLPEYESMKKTSIQEANAQLYKIREDVRAKYDSLSNEARLNLVITDFAFQHPEEYKVLMEFPVVFEKEQLLSNPHFVALCSKSKVDTAQIQPYCYLPEIIKPNVNDHLKNEEQRLDSLIALANAEIERKNYDAAIHHLDECLRIDSNQAEALFLRAYSKFNLNMADFGYEDCKLSAQLGNAEAIKMLRICWEE